MNSSEELIKERNSLSQKTYTETKSVCIILEASERIPLGSPLGNPRIRNLRYGGCLCLPLFLSPFSPRGFQREKESPQLIWSTQRKKKKKLPPTVCHPGTLAVCSLPSPCPLPPPVELFGPGLFLRVCCALHSALSTLFGTA